MDRLERFFLNKSVFGFFVSLLILYVIAISACGYASDYCAKKVITNQVYASLSAAGGNMADADFILNGENDEYIKTAEECFSKYGIDKDISPELVYNYNDTKTFIFTVFGLFITGVFLIILIFGLISRMRVMKSIDKIRQECNKITNDCFKTIWIDASDNTSVRNLADSINKLVCMAENTSSQLKKEQHFLKEFLTNFSHQLKTPCAVIRLNNELLENIECLTEKKSRILIGEINSQLDLLETLLNESLKIARLNANTIEYDFKSRNITELCSELVYGLSPIAEANNIKLMFKESPDIYMKFDNIWLREAISNIVKNSLEHSNAKEVSVSVSSLPTSVSVIIEDNGDGIPQKKIPQIFERYNTKSSDTSVKTSVGIGMAISKKIITVHNGDILVFSKQGEGTRFEIIFLKK